MSNLDRKLTVNRDRRAKRQREARAYVEAWRMAHEEKFFRDRGLIVPAYFNSAEAPSPRRRIVVRNEAGRKVGHQWLFQDRQLKWHTL